MTHFRYKMTPSIPLIMTCFICIILSSCGAGKKEYKSPPGYNLNTPIVYKLPETLNEISGIVFYPKDSGLFAINDEQGWLYKIYIQKTPIRVERWKFANSGDYEDIALVDSTFYVLKSKGKLEKFGFVGGEVVDQQSYDIPFSDDKKEFETLYYDQNKKQLVIICKDCKGDGGQALGWTFDPATNAFSSNFALDTKEIFTQLQKTDAKKLKASAAAINPLTDELYVISSVQRTLAIYDKNNDLKAVYAISPGIFKQPEGMTFTPKGDLIITNESGDVGFAEILIFKYKNK